MDFRTLFVKISENDFGGAYILHGEEEFGKEKAVDAFVATLPEAVRDFNLDYLDDPSADEIIAASSTMPMMSSTRIVIAYGTKNAEKEQETNKLKTYFASMPSFSVLLIVVRGKMDGRKALYKYLDKEGRAVNFEHYSEQEASRWVENFAKKHNRKISSQDARMLVMMAGVNLSSLSDEMNKLVVYSSDVITVSDIRDLVLPRNDFAVFEMLESFLAGRTGQGFAQLHNAFDTEGTGAVMQLLSFFASRMRNMLTAARVLKSGGGAQQAAKAIGGNPYAAKKSVEAARKFTIEELESAMLLLSAVDIDIKSGRRSGEDALEDALIKIFVGSVSN